MGSWLGIDLRRVVGGTAFYGRGRGRGRARGSARARRGGPQDRKIVNGDGVGDAMPGHFFQFGYRIVAFAVEPEIIAVAVKKNEFGDIVLEGQPVGFEQPVVVVERVGTAMGGTAFYVTRRVIGDKDWTLGANSQGQGLDK